MALFFLLWIYTYINKVFIGLLKDYVFPIIQSNYFIMNIYELCKTILDKDQEDKEREMTIKENSLPCNFKNFLNAYFANYKFVQWIGEDFKNLAEFLILETKICIQGECKNIA